MTVAEIRVALWECERSTRGQRPQYIEVTFDEWCTLRADKMFRQAYGFDKNSGRETLFGVPVHVGHREFTLVM